MAPRRNVASPSGLAAVVLLASLATAAAAASPASSPRMCFFPNGDVSTHDLPCGTGKTTTHCCNAQSICLSVGLCLTAEQAPYVLSRGSCTDASWGSGCPTHCVGSKNNPGGGMPISWTGSSGAAQYCCNGLAVNNDTVACADDETPFTLPQVQVLFGAALLENTTTDNDGPSPSSVAPSPSQTGSVDSGGGGSGDNSTNSGGSNNNGDGDDDDSTMTTTTTTSGPNATAVGAGVGVPLGLLALGALSWALWERRARKQQLLAFQGGGGSPSSTDAGPAAYYATAARPVAFSPGTTSSATLSVYGVATSTKQHQLYPNQGTAVELSAHPRHMEELPS
ncbi:hypothetical protein SPI_06914 [Niveomyces insectorum RCEF 264]|uniref:Uncharacterized protein n=1 Tax=Niveomyces insectorum RCEF 264 TaxID=1081102 RepID=A0A167QW94_9HYPO|nr:hypothetical protein SPI_06914 [Niveomyces insectorum RCEF 264]